jgi:hypothetical protein
LATPSSVLLLPRWRCATKLLVKIAMQFIERRAHPE